VNADDVRVPITVYVTADQYQTLAGEAQVRGFERITEMVADWLVMSAGAASSARVVALHARNLDDGEIATQLGQTRTWVAKMRRGAGLTANRGAGRARR
jgi:hypothetical protein